MRTLGEIWKHFEILSDDQTKRHVMCVYCSKEYQYGCAPRMRAHLVQCIDCPEETKKKFRRHPSAKQNSECKPKRERTSRIWDHYEILNVAGSNRHASCLYCSKEYKYGSASRLKAHLLYKCQQCPEEIKKTFERQRPIKQEATRERERTPNRKLLDTSSDDNDAGIDDGESNDATTNDAETNEAEANDAGTMDTGTADAGTCQIFPSTSADMGEENVRDPLHLVNIDEKLVRAMYYSGVDLAMFESKYWKEALNAANIHIPSRHCIRNTLLDAEFNRVLTGINNLLESSGALALITDGWKHVDNKSVVYFILTTPQPIFIKSVYADMKRSTGEYLGQEIINVIEEVGSAKLVAVITDNATNMKTAWRTVNNKYPHISCVGCVSQTLNLLLTDIMNIRTCKQIHEKSVSIIDHILHNATILGKFEKIQTKKYGKTQCTLELPNATKSSGEVRCLESLRLNKEALETLALSNILDIETQEFVLDESFWTALDETVSVIQPISDALKQSKSDSASLSDVPAIFSNIETSICRVIQSIINLSIEERHKIKQAITNRKEFCIQPIHLASNYLDPRYRGEHLGTSLPAAVEFIEEYASYIYNGDEEKIAAVMENALQFKVKSGYYGKTNSIWRKFTSTTPSEWWQAFAPQEILAPIAIRLLSVPPSSAGPGINWSLFGATNVDKRYNLDKERLNKLIYIRANLRLMDDQSAKDLIDDVEVASDRESYVEDSKDYGLRNEDIKILNCL